MYAGPLCALLCPALVLSCLFPATVLAAETGDGKGRELGQLPSERAEQRDQNLPLPKDCGSPELQAHEDALEQAPGDHLIDDLVGSLASVKIDDAGAAEEEDGSLYVRKGDPRSRVPSYVAGSAGFPWESDSCQGGVSEATGRLIRAEVGRPRNDYVVGIHRASKREVELVIEEEGEYLGPAGRWYLFNKVEALLLKLLENHKLGEVSARDIGSLVMLWERQPKRSGIPKRFLEKVEGNPLLMRDEFKHASRYDSLETGWEEEIEEVAAVMRAIAFKQEIPDWDEIAYSAGYIPAIRFAAARGYRNVLKVLLKDAKESKLFAKEVISAVVADRTIRSAGLQGEIGLWGHLVGRFEDNGKIEDKIGDGEGEEHGLTERIKKMLAEVEAAPGISPQARYYRLSSHADTALNWQPDEMQWLRREIKERQLYKIPYICYIQKLRDPRTQRNHWLPLEDELKLLKRNPDKKLAVVLMHVLVDDMMAEVAKVIGPGARQTLLAELLRKLVQEVVTVFDKEQALWIAKMCCYAIATDKRLSAEVWWEVVAIIKEYVAGGFFPEKAASIMLRALLVEAAREGWTEIMMAIGLSLEEAQAYQANDCNNVVMLKLLEIHASEAEAVLERDSALEGEGMPDEQEASDEKEACGAEGGPGPHNDDSAAFGDSVTPSTLQDEPGQAVTPQSERSASAYDSLAEVGFVPCDSDHLECDFVPGGEDNDMDALD